MSHTCARKGVSHTYEKKALRHFGVEGFEFGVLDVGAGWSSGCSLVAVLQASGRALPRRCVEGLGPKALNLQ